MNIRRAGIGVSILAALFVSALAAQGAAAATVGTTAFTCKPVTPAAGTEGFEREHCQPTDAVKTNAKFEHVPFNEETTTDIEITNTKTRNNTTEREPTVLKATVAGAPIEIVAQSAHGSGGLVNRKDPTGEHFVLLHEFKIAHTEVTEKLLGCKVTGKPGGAGVIETRTLTGTTTGQGDAVKFSPTEGTLIEEFELTECAIGPITIKVVGSIIGKPSGATITFVHNEVTAAKTLRLQSAAGPVAGIGGSLTLSGKDTAAGDTKFTPLSFTTVETS
jgi:hypothetical protein